MKITEIRLSVFELPANTRLFDLARVEVGAARQWERRPGPAHNETIQLLHVFTDAGVEGICTVGDARYTNMRPFDLEQLRHLTLGADPRDREFLYHKLHAATRSMFTMPGWFGAFDNCLWDIIGKLANQPVYALLGRARASCPAYYNVRGGALEATVEDAHAACEAGYVALKDHFLQDATRNIHGFEAMRAAVGPDIDLLHDAALCSYTYADALRVGRALETLGYGWFEEPLPDRDQIGLQRLCAQLDIPIVAAETLMHDIDLSRLWLIQGATDWLRANARLGVTPLMKLAHLAELHGARIELNGPGGLFGLVHAHLVCALENTSYYEYFPGGSRDEIGAQIGLTNPPLPHKGRITPPTGPGWGAEWDWATLQRRRTAYL
ncbi:MAG: enolase C-terminal domain-like protein [Litorilinea sp.]